jgi:3-hydroxyisobutyrate dehydrogenase-like beta-hydroxyacid dehydrogenase
MGSALARALLTGGHRVTVWNRTQAKCGPLLETGARSAGSVIDAVSAANVVLVCITNHAATREVLFHETVGKALRGRLLIQLSTVAAEESRELAAWSADHGIAYLEGSIVGFPRDVTQGAAIIAYAGPKDLEQPGDAAAERGFAATALTDNT